MDDTMTQLHVVDHPLVADLVTRLRDKRTGAGLMRSLVYQVGALLAYEATRDLPTEEVGVQTPMEATQGRRVRDMVTVVPVLRAGLAMAEGVLGVIPDAVVGHVGLYRDEETLEPVTYLEKLPEGSRSGQVILVDPMLATGGSAVAGLRYLEDQGCEQVCMICLVAAPEGVRRLGKSHPRVPIYTAALDRCLDERGFILPGLGDAGDRLYGTG